MHNLQAFSLELELRGIPMHFAWLCALSTRVKLEDLRQHVVARLSRFPHACDHPLHSGRFQGWRWEKAADFALPQHIREIRLGVSTTEHILPVCARLFAKPLLLSKPLWEVYLLQPARGSSYLFLKAHRGLLPPEDDAAFLNALLDPQPKPPQREQPRDTSSSPIALPGNLGSQAHEKATKAHAADVFRVLEPLVRHPRKAVRNLRAYADSLLNVARILASPPPPKAQGWNGPLSPKRKLHATVIPMSVLRQVRDRVGGTITDIVLACFANSLEAIRESQTATPDNSALHVLVTLSLGSEQDARRTGVRTALAIARLPGGVSDPVERLRRVSAELDRLRAIDTTQHYQRSVRILQLLPTAVASALARLLPETALTHTICLQVPALQEQRYMAGNVVTSVIPFTPLLLDIRVALAFMIYADQLCVGFTVDSASPHAKHDLARIFEASVSELLDAAGVTLSPAATKRGKPRTH